ncbi:hypothetical protein ACZ11_20180 [Lysinibacillus xylanilyticus]|uniref:Uncharacterized protein n=1 Tax=Lysinibacillus xylanilyticus TaxID=582475 RepID=A0A0K9F476_9BACI|nr:hypothetical protein ACZ11_20180 [Lysinibacillus xylanilyticus]
MVLTNKKIEAGCKTDQSHQKREKINFRNVDFSRFFNVEFCSGFIYLTKNGFKNYHNIFCYWLHLRKVIGVGIGLSSSAMLTPKSSLFVSL